MVWFPRPRGDGPWDMSPRVAVAPVSPPTRGWTVSGAGVVDASIGFPAHAGMDLMHHFEPEAFGGFPRPRGDGPESVCREVLGIVVSPPTRGWTLRLRQLAVGFAGFPAHAGMDRGRRCPRPCGRRFPRPRGDGPLTTTLTIAVVAVSPPTRGWTVRLGRGPCHAVGFPAHAGMDPRGSHDWPGANWFPRPRGDGPSSTAQATRLRSVSPPTRDGPLIAISLPPMALVSPPTRGWTPHRLHSEPPHAGFPAHAGMDPRC